MRITFLGTGTSQGVPVIACDCPVCTSPDHRDLRLRTSVMITSERTNLVIDSGPDFRQQMLRARVKKLDGIVFTHEHKDHIAGLDDVRAFNYFSREKMPVYCTDRVEEALRREYMYAFSENRYPGVPEIQLHRIENKPFQISDILFNPIEVLHLKMTVLGFRINDLVYITDANYISEEEKNKLRGCRYLILNALRKEPHPSHFTLDEAINLAKEIEPQRTYFTHISHQLGKHEEIEKELPENMYLSYDGLEIEF